MTKIKNKAPAPKILKVDLTKTFDQKLNFVLTLTGNFFISFAENCSSWDNSDIFFTQLSIDQMLDLIVVRWCDIWMLW